MNEFGVVSLFYKCWYDEIYGDKF